MGYVDRQSPKYERILWFSGVLVLQIYLCVTFSVATDLPVQIKLHEQAQVTGPSILLGEIAQIQAPDGILKQLQQVRIAAAPQPGKSRTLYQPHIRTRLIQARILPVSQMRIEGKQITVQTAQYIWSPEKLLADAQDFLRQQFGNRSIQVRPASPIQSMTVGDTDARIEFRWVSAPPMQLDVAPVTVEARLISNHKPVARQNIVLKPVLRAQVAVAKRPLAVNHLIIPADVTFVEADSKSEEDGSVIGGMTKRAFTTGETIRAKDVKYPVLVRQGDEVTLMVQRGQLKVSAQGRALQAGQYGQKIRVHNLVSDKEQIGIVAGPREILLSGKN